MTTPTVLTWPARFGRNQPLPSPDFLIEDSPGDNTFIVGPCHSAAAVWLHGWAEPSALWVGEGVSLKHRDVRELITSATRAGFSLRLRMNVGSRLRLVETFGVTVSV